MGGKSGPSPYLSGKTGLVFLASLTRKTRPAVAIRAFDIMDRLPLDSLGLGRRDELCARRGVVGWILIH